MASDLKKYYLKKKKDIFIIIFFFHGLYCKGDDVNFKSLFSMSAPGAAYFEQTYLLNLQL